MIERAARITKGTVITDRKSTRLNSSHMSISYAVFCLKKKKLLVQVTAGAPRSFGAGREEYARTRRDELTEALLAGGAQSVDRRFFFNVTATTEIYTLSLHDALPI